MHDDVVLLSKLGSGLLRLLNKLCEFCAFSSLEVNLSKTQIMIIGYNKKEIKPRGTLRRQLLRSPSTLNPGQCNPLLTNYVNITPPRIDFTQF